VLRYHPACFYKASDNAPTESWPALLAAITDPRGTITGVHRTWLDRSGLGKAPVAEPRRSMGYQIGNGARFSGLAAGLMVAGEGLENVLSVRVTLPRVPAVAGLSAHHLAVLELPPGVKRLYIARDGDAEGTRAADTLRERADKAGIPEVCDLYPFHDDFNTDLLRLGPDGLAGHIAVQLAPEDSRWLMRSWPEGIVRVASAPRALRSRGQGRGLSCAGLPAIAGEGRASAFFERATGARTGPCPQRRSPTLFRRPSAFAARSKRVGLRRPPLCSGPWSTPRRERHGGPVPRGAGPPRPWLFGRHEGRGGRGLPQPGAYHAQRNRLRARH
jgi:hypothetical protein